MARRVLGHGETVDRALVTLQSMACDMVLQENLDTARNQVGEPHVWLGELEL